MRNILIDSIYPIIFCIVYLISVNHSYAQISLGSQKAPQTILLNTRPGSIVHQVPTKPGGTYTVDYGEGNIRKIDLLPPVIIELETVNRNIEGYPLPEQFAAGKGFFVNYTTEDGLSNDAISCSMMDSKGNLWFGFHAWGDGVSRFDGKSFTNITILNGLVNNHVNCISEDRNGNLWFGTFGGISRYDGTTFKSFSIQDGLLSNYVYSILEDTSGNIWFGTLEGVSCYNGKSFTNYSASHGLEGSWFTGLVEDNNDNIWFGTHGSGIYCFDGKTFKHFTKSHGLASDYINDIAVDKNGSLWICTSKGVTIYDGKSFTTLAYELGFTTWGANCITRDNEGNIWLGSSRGATYFDGQSFSDITLKQGLPNQLVNSITVDKSGNAWLCTASGLTCYKGKSVINFPFQAEIIKSEVFSIIQDKNKDLWFGTNGDGIWRYDGKSFKNFTRNQGLAGDGVRSIIEDKIGNLWFSSSSGGGVSKYDGTSFTNYTSEQGLIDDFVQCTLEDLNGNIWFGTLSGLSCFNGESFTNYTKEQGLINDSIMCCALDKKGNIWFGTLEGISQFSGNRFYNYKINNGQQKNEINCITEDENGNIWFGTNTGIYCLSQPNIPTEGGIENLIFETYTTSNGLPDNVINQIVKGENNLIYVGTKSGICELRSGPSGKRKVGTIFNSASGYPFKAVISGQNSLYKDNEGILWMGTSAVKSGLVRFDPSKINTNPFAPNVIITNIKIRDEEISWYTLKPGKYDSATITQQEINTYGNLLTATVRDSITTILEGVQFSGIGKFYLIPENLILPYNHNNITISFMGIEVDRNYLVRYQYILEGHSKGWSSLTENTEAVFENIFEGTYNFKLKALSPDGVWSQPITYTFKVLPPWYRHWFAYISYLFLLITFLWLLYRFNLKKALRRQELKHEISSKMSELEMKSLRSQMNPHFIFNSLQSIQNFLMNNKSEKANDYLLKFSKLMRLVLENSQQKEVSLKDDMMALDLYMQLEQLRFTNPFEYEIIMDNSIDTEHDTIPPLLLQPFVENAIWHGLQYKSEPGKIVIQFKKENNILYCVVEDNGVGRSYRKELKSAVFKKESLGMKLTAERIKLLEKVHGVEAKLSIIDIYNTENKPAGTKVELLLPVIV